MFKGLDRIDELVLAAQRDTFDLERLSILFDREKPVTEGHRFPVPLELRKRV